MLSEGCEFDPRGGLLVIFKFSVSFLSTLIAHDSDTMTSPFIPLRSFLFSNQAMTFSSRFPSSLQLEGELLAQMLHRMVYPS